MRSVLVAVNVVANANAQIKIANAKMNQTARSVSVMISVSAAMIVNAIAKSAIAKKSNVMMIIKSWPPGQLFIQ